MQDFLFSKGIRISLWRNWKLLCQLVGHCIMSHVRQRSPRCLNKNRRSERSADNMGFQDCSNILMASNNTFLSTFEYIFISKIAIYFLIYTIQMSSRNVYYSNIAPNEPNAMWTNGLEEHSYRWKNCRGAQEEWMRRACNSKMPEWESWNSSLATTLLRCATNCTKKEFAKPDHIFCTREQFL